MLENPDDGPAPLELLGPVLLPKAGCVGDVTNLENCVLLTNGEEFLVVPILDVTPGPLVDTGRTGRFG